MSDETFRAIAIAIVTLLGSGTIGGAFLAWVLRNRRLEKAQTDKEIVSVDAARLTTILESSGDLEEIATRIADSTFERSEKEIARVEERYERDTKRLESRILKLEKSLEDLSTRFLDTKDENEQLKKNVAHYSGLVEKLTLDHQKYNLVVQANYYTMILHRVEPTIDPARIDSITMAELERTVEDLKDKVKDQSNFHELPSGL